MKKVIFIETEEQCSSAILTLSSYKDKPTLNRCTAYRIPVNLSYNVTIKNTAAIIIEQNDIFYVFNISHPDMLNTLFFKKLFTSNISIHCPNKREFLRIGWELDKSVDLGYYDISSNKPKYSHYIDEIMKKYPTGGYIIPLVKWVEYCIENSNYFNKITYNNIDTIFDLNMLNIMNIIESSGICIDSKKLEEYFPEALKEVEDGRIYSRLNPYTITGRITQGTRFINLNSLSKTTGERSCIVADKQRVLMMMDFISFHPRILANEVLNYQLELDFYSHEFPSLSKESAKKSIFNILYGEHDINTESVFLNKVIEFKKSLTSTFISPITGRTLNMGNLEEYKRMAHVMQFLESEITMSIFDKIFKKIRLQLSRPVLYSYDSIVFDSTLHGQDEILSCMKEIDEKYPVRFYKGLNYHDMKLIS